MWFLDLGSWVCGCIGLLFVSLAIKEITTYRLGFALIYTFIVVFLCISISLVYVKLEERAFSLYPQESYAFRENGFTLGEVWCNYTEYEGELCKDYVEYALNKQNLAEQKKREKQLKKQQKLDEELAQKNKVRANYENLVKDIINTKDTQ